MKVVEGGWVETLSDGVAIWEFMWQNTVGGTKCEKGYNCDIWVEIVIICVEDKTFFNMYSRSDKFCYKAILQMK